MSFIIDFPLKRNLINQENQLLKYKQLELPLYEKNIGIIPIEDMFGATINKKIYEIQPDLAIDLRHINIFDFPGTNKNIIFQIFNKFNTRYKLSPFSWHDISQKDFMDFSYKTIDLFDGNIFEKYKSILLIVPKKENELMARIYINIQNSKYQYKFNII